MNARLCRKTATYEYYYLSPENAKEVLNRIGHGSQKCQETASEDGRYGKVVKKGIAFGFKNCECFIPFGRYIVFGDDLDYTYSTYSVKEFIEEYQPI